MLCFIFDSMAKAVGVLFHPTGVELVVYFLKRKVMAKKICDGFIAELDIYKYAPWGIPGTFITLI